MAIELHVPGARAVIEPRFGGRLHQLLIEIDGREEPVLFSPADVAEYEREPLVGGCYPMAPWPNRIRAGTFRWLGRDYTVPLDARGEALHGLVFDQPWEVTARVGRVVEIACDLPPAWPWEGRAWQRFELGPGFLAMKLEVRSAREPFPAGCGWHPWFRRDVAGSTGVGVSVPARSRYLLEANLPAGGRAAVDGEFALDGAPLGDRRLDDCYTNLDEAVATIEWQRLRLGLRFDCRVPHLQVYTPPEAFCLEPQTCAPDAFNLAAAGATDDGTAAVAPGRALSLTARWTWATR